MVRIQLLLLGCLILHTQAWRMSGRDLREDEAEDALLHILQRQAGGEGNRQWEDSDDDDACQPIGNMLDRFVTSDHWKTLKDYISSVWSSGPGKKELDIWGMLKEELGGLDLGKAADRHNLSCMIYITPNIKELLVKFGHSERTIKKYLMQGNEFFSLFGGIGGLEDLTSMASGFGTWALRTGYPRIPLKGDVTKAEVKEEIEKWNQLYYNIKVDDKTRKSWDKELHGYMIPLRFNPDYAASTITGATSSKRLLEGLCMKENDSDRFIKHDMAKVIIAFTDLWDQGLEMLRHLQTMGYFKI